MNTIVKKVGEGTAWMSLSTFLIKFISIAYSLIVLSFLSVFEYGLVELAISIPMIISFFNLAGLDPVLIADLGEVKRKKESKIAAKILSSYVVLRVVLSIAAFMILMTISLYFMDGFSIQVQQMVSLLSLTFLVSPIRSLILISCNVLHKFKALSLFSFLEESIKLVLVFIFLSFYELGPVGVILAYVASEVILTILFIPMVLKLFKGFDTEFKWLSEPFYVLQAHARWSVVQSGVHSFGQNIRPWIIQHFLGVPAVGIYSLATGMFQHVSSLFPLWRVVSPIIPSYLSDSKKLAQLINSTIKYQALILTMNSIAAIIFIPILINTFFPDYESAYPLFLLLALALLPASFSRVFVSAFHALKLQKNLFTSGVFLLVMTTLFLPVAIMVFGLYGIAVEYFITLSIYAFGRYRILKKHIDGYSFSLRDMLTVTITDRIIWQRIHKNMISRFGFLKR